jgi:hypothetical protein
MPAATSATSLTGTWSGASADSTGQEKMTWAVAQESETVWKMRQEYGGGLNADETGSASSRAPAPATTIVATER